MISNLEFEELATLMPCMLEGLAFGILCAFVGWGIHKIIQSVVLFAK